MYLVYFVAFVLFCTAVCLYLKKIIYVDSLENKYLFYLCYSYTKFAVEIDN